MFTVLTLGSLRIHDVCKRGRLRVKRGGNVAAQKGEVRTRKLRGSREAKGLQEVGGEIS